MLRKAAAAAQDLPEDVPFHQLTLPSFLARFPFPVVLWDKDRTRCVVNEHAQQLVGLKTRGPKRVASSWCKRIYHQDRIHVSSAWKRIRQGEAALTVDYRFTPAGGDQLIWLREVTVAQHDLVSNLPGWLSVYMDISDLKTIPREEVYRPGNQDVSPVIDGLVHALQNSLQTISMGIDLLSPQDVDQQDYEIVSAGVEQASRLLREVQTYFSPSEQSPVQESITNIVAAYIQQFQKDWGRRDDQVEIRCAKELTQLSLDWSRFQKTVERILHSAFAILTADGRMTIEIDSVMITESRYLRFVVHCQASQPLQVNEEELSHSSFRLNGYHLGFSFMLVRHQLCRQQETATFHKPNPCECVFTVLFQL